MAPASDPRLALESLSSTRSLYRLVSLLLVGVLGCGEASSSGPAPNDATGDARDGDAADAGVDGPGDAEDGDAPDLLGDADGDSADDPDLETDVGLPPRDYESLWALDRVQSFWVEISEAEWNALLHDFDQNPRNEVYRRATLRWGETHDRARVFGDVGLRLRGNVFTRARPELDGHEDGVHHADNPLRRVHFKLRLDEEFDEDESVYGSPSPDVPERPENDGRGLVDGVETLNLKYNNNDPSYLREVLSFDLFRRFGVAAPRAAYVRLHLTIGDEPPRYVGLFLLIEQLDADWVRRQFGASDFLFKCLYQSLGPADLSAPDTEPGEAAGTIGIEQTDPDVAGVWPDFEPYRPSYDLKTNRDDFSEAEAALNELMALLRGAPTLEELEGALDVDAILRMMALNVFVGMADDYWRNGNNYYLLRRPDDGRWVTIPWDYDRTFGIPTIGGDPATASFLDWGAESNVAPLLMERLLAVPELRDLYLDHVASLVDEPGGLGTEAAVEARMEALQALIAPSTADYDAEDEDPYDADLTELLGYVRARVATARAELDVAR